MDGVNEWTVVVPTKTATTQHGVAVTVDGTTEVRVVADEFSVGTNGDLAFGTGLFGSRPTLDRAFAAGSWVEVRLYA